MWFSDLSGKVQEPALKKPKTILDAGLKTRKKTTSYNHIDNTEWCNIQMEYDFRIGTQASLNFLSGISESQVVGLGFFFN